MKPLGLYLHIPFCRSKCLYCDFCSFPHTDAEKREAYVAALCRDLEEKAAACTDYSVDTVYLGGGTPTLLSAEQTERILGTVARCYHLAKDAEITAECNPATADRPKLAAMRRAGINRLSIGLQSARKEELKLLGRTHSFTDFCSTWEAARSVGFSNLSADVMFGIPSQTPKTFAGTLEAVAALEPEHLSAYALTLEEGTPLFRLRENYSFPDEDATAKMYCDAVDFLAGRGIFQYEISNFAKPGYESRHNLKYWKMGEYLGFGPAAYSDFGGERFGNTRDLDGYLAGLDVTAERERATEKTREAEYVMLRMRLCEGLDAGAFRERFGKAPDAYLSRLSRYLEEGFVRRTERGIAFTVRGMLVSNSILSEILDFSE